MQSEQKWVVQKPLCALVRFLLGTTKKAAKEKPTVPYEQIKPRVASSCMVNSPVITVDIKKTKEPYRDQILSLV